MLKGVKQCVASDSDSDSRIRKSCVAVKRTHCAGVLHNLYGSSGLVRGAERCGQLTASVHGTLPLKNKPKNNNIILRVMHSFSSSNINSLSPKIECVLLCQTVGVSEKPEVRFDLGKYVAMKTTQAWIVSRVWPRGKETV